MVNKDELVRFLLINKPFALQAQKLIARTLQDEESRLQQLAESALTRPELRDSALLQLGRVALLRDILSYFKLYLSEQKHG